MPHEPRTPSPAPWNLTPRAPPHSTHLTSVWQRLPAYQELRNDQEEDSRDREEGVGEGRDYGDRGHSHGHSHGHRHSHGYGGTHGGDGADVGDMGNRNAFEEEEWEDADADDDDDDDDQYIYVERELEWGWASRRWRRQALAVRHMDFEFELDWMSLIAAGAFVCSFGLYLI